MDAIAFVHEPESVQVMVKELVEGRATGTRAALYTTAFSLVPRPNMRAIQALELLFKAGEAHLFSARLAAASMVNAYCRHNPHCYDESPVRSLSQAIKQKIEEDLSPSSNEVSAAGPVRPQESGQHGRCDPGNIRGGASLHAKREQESQHPCGCYTSLQTGQV